MTPTLYFLRSSEQYIVNKMLPYAYRLDVLGKSLEDVPQLGIYKDFYGFTRKDLGLYAMVEHEMAGAIWSRKMQVEHTCQAFIDEQTPVISMAVLPKYQKQGIASAMLEQFLQEASVLYKQVCVSVVADSHAKKIYEKFGFETVGENISAVDGSKTLTLLKTLEGTTLVRPSEGYDPTRWMD